MVRIFSHGKFFRRLRAALPTAFCLLLVLPSSLLAAESLEEGARREGVVSFYSSIPAPQTQILMSAFQKKYPFIKAEYYRGSTTTLLPKILAEKQMGKTFADVVSTNGILVNILKKNGILGKYISPEAKFIPQGFKDPEGFWTANYTAYFIFTYNTKMVDNKELPKTYEDLLHPRWKGKIGISLDEAEWFIGMMDFLGEEKGRQFMKRLAENNPVLRRGRSVTAILMLAREFPLALGVIQTTRQRLSAGAPIGMIHFSVPTLAGMRMIGVHAHAPHPNAAKLLVNFLLSKEGQTIYQQNGYDPVRMDVKVDPLVEKIMQNMFPIKPRDPEVVEEYKQEMAKIFDKKVIQQQR